MLRKHLSAIDVGISQEPLDYGCPNCGVTPSDRRQKPRSGCRYCSISDEPGWSEEYKAYLDSKPVAWFRARYLASLKKS